MKAGQVSATTGFGNTSTSDVGLKRLCPHQLRGQEHTKIQQAHTKT